VRTAATLRPVQLSLLYFAALRDLAQRSEETFESQGSSLTVAGLCAELTRKRPNLRWEGVRVAVNEEFVDSDFALSSGDVVAFIPPVSGG
jgi:molybdopterin synthase sulfur carrier subunit